MKQTIVIYAYDLAEGMAEAYKIRANGHDARVIDAAQFRGEREKCEGVMLLAAGRDNADELAADLADLYGEKMLEPGEVEPVAVKADAAPKRSRNTGARRKRGAPEGDADENE